MPERNSRYLLVQHLSYERLVVAKRHGVIANVDDGGDG